jgi:hypothetical protein
MKDDKIAVVEDEAERVRADLPALSRTRRRQRAGA